MNPLPMRDAEAIWAVLVAHAGASNDPLDRAAFVQHQSIFIEPEWRFQGSLGLGGKFRRHRRWTCDGYRETWTVDCYTEDETPARAAVIEATNQALADLQKEKLQ